MDELGTIAAMYSDYHDRLFVHAYAILGDRELAREAVQEAFLAALRKPWALIKSENPLGWLKKAVRFAALHILEDTQVARTLSISLDERSDADVPGHAYQGDGGLLDRCLQAVGEENLRLFLRISMDGYSFQEEARRLHISVAACYKRFERIRERLRQALKDKE